MGYWKEINGIKVRVAGQPQGNDPIEAPVTNVEVVKKVVKPVKRRK